METEVIPSKDDLWDEMHGQTITVDDPLPDKESIWATRYNRDPIWGIEAAVQKPMAQRLAPVLRGQAAIEDILVEQDPVGTIPEKYDSLRTMFDADPDPQAIRDKMTASLLLSERLGVSPSTAYRDWDYLTEQVYHAPMKPGQFLQNYRKRMGIEIPKPEFKPSIVMPTADQARQRIEQATPYYEPVIPNLAERAGEDPNLRLGPAPLRETGKPWIPNPNLVRPVQEMPGPEYKGALDEFARAFQSNDAALFASAVKFIGIHPLNTWLAPEWSRSVREYADQVKAVANSPEFAPTGEGGIAGFVSRAVAGTLPFTLATTAAYLTGGTSAAFSVGAIGEGVPAYEYALEKTGDEGTALIHGLVVGAINGTIEKLQVSEIVGTMNATKLYAVTRSAQVKALNAIAGQGKNLTRKYIETAVDNAIQESLQEITQIGGEFFVSDIDILDAIQRVASSGVGGAVGGVFLSGAGGMVQYAASKAAGQTDQQAAIASQTVQDVRRQTGAAVSRPGRAELKSQLIQNTVNISEEQVEMAMKILDAAAAAQDQSTDEYIAEKIVGVEAAEDHAERVERIQKQGFSAQEAESIASTLESLESEIEKPSTMAQDQQSAEGLTQTTPGETILYQDEGELFEDEKKPLPRPQKRITSEVERYLSSVLKSDPAAMDYAQILQHLQDLHALKRVFPNQAKRIRSAMKQAESFKPSKREIAREIASTQKDIVQHDIYQQTLDDLLNSMEDIRPTAVEPTFKGEVQNFLEGRPYLKGQITIGPAGTSSTWGKQLQQWSERTGKPDPANINAWLDLVDLKMRLQQGRAINPEALQRAVQTGEPNIGWLADKLKMLKSGKSLKEIRQAEKEVMGEVKPKKAEPVEDEFADFFDFEKKPRRKAATQFLADGRAVIKAFSGADISSVVHELAHIFRRGVKGEDLKALERWAGVVDGVWTRENEEKFARGFEKYLYEGIAPSSTMQKIFDLFRKWLLDIYRELERSAIDVKINDEVRKVFDRILTLERQEVHPGELTFVEFRDKLIEQTGLPDSPWIRRYGIQTDTSVREEWKRMKVLAKQTQADLVAREKEQADAVPLTEEQAAEIASIESEEPAEAFVLDAKKLTVADLLDQASKDGLNKVRAKKALRLAYESGQKAGEKTATEKGKAKLAAKLAEAKEHYRQVVLEAKARQAVKDTIRKLGRRISRKIPAAMTVEYKEAIQAIQDGFDPSYRTRKTLGNRKRIAELVRQNPGMKIPDSILAQAGKKSLGEFYFDELESMAAEVDRLIHLGRLKYTLWREQWDRDREAERAAIVATLSGYEPGQAKPASVALEKREGVLTRAAKGLRAASLRPSALADLIDGGKARFNGMAFKLIRTLSGRARNQELVEAERRQGAFDAFLTTNGMTIHDLHTVVRLGGSMFTTDEIVGIYTRRLNPKSRLAMRFGNGISEDQIAQAVYHCEVADPRLAKLSRFILGEYESNYSRLDDAFVLDTGLAGNPRRMAKEPNYTSIVRLEVYDPKSGNFRSASEGEVLAEQNTMLRGIGRYYAEHGMTQSRREVPAEFQSRILLGLVEGWMRDVSRQEHYIAHVELQKIYHRVFWDRETAELIKDRLGAETLDEIKALLNRTIDPDSIRKYDFGSVFFRSMKKNGGVVFLAGNLLSIVKAPVSVMTYSPFCGGPIRLIASALKFAANPVGQWNAVRELAPQVKTPMLEQMIDDVHREMAFVRAGKLGLVGKVKTQIQAGFMSIYTLFDGISRTIGWDAVYQYGLSEGLSHDEAASAADEATTRTQGASAARDLPGLYTKNEGMTAFLTFTNELNQVWNLATYDIPRNLRNKAYTRAMLTLFGILLSESIIWAITYRRLPEDKRDWMSLTTNTLASPIPVVGSVLGARAIYPLAESGQKVYESSQRAILAGDPGKVNWEAVLETTALLYGIPYIGPKRIIQAVSEGDPAYLVGGPKRKKAQ